MPDLGFAVVVVPFAFEVVVVAFFLEGGALAAVERVDVLATVESFAAAGLGFEEEEAALVGFLGLLGDEGLATLGLVAVLGLGADLTGDFDLERDLDDEVDFDPFFMFNFSRRRGVTLYDALILVSVPSSTPFLRALRK